MNIAKLKVIGANISVVNLKTVTSGMVGATVEIEYDDTWSSLRKQVVFKTVYGVFNADDNIVPPEVLKAANMELLVGVYGYSADGTLAIPTVWASLGKIKPGADPEGDESANPTLPVWARIQTQMGNLDNLKTAAKANLVAAVNELADAGVDTAQIQRIIEEYLAEHDVGGKADLTVNDPAQTGYVAGRTHWRETVTAPLNIWWDGEINDRYHISVPGADVHIAKVSDQIISDEALAKCVIFATVVGEGDGAIPIEADGIEHFGTNSTVYGGAIFIVREANEVAADYSVCIAEPGIYFIKSDTAIIKALSTDTAAVEQDGYRQIDRRYLPAAVMGADIAQDDPAGPGFIRGLARAETLETVIESQAFSGEHVITTVECDVEKRYVVTCDGVIYVRSFTEYLDTHNNASVYFCGNPAVWAPDSGYVDTGEPFCMVWAPHLGWLVLFTIDDGAEHTIIVDKIVTTTKIPAKYLPPHLEFPAVTAADAGKTLQWVVDESGNWVPQIVEGTT